MVSSLDLRKKIFSTVFLLLAGRIPIIIGLLHLFVHFNSLLDPTIETYLQGGNINKGISVPLWETWGVVSFMMGLCSIVIGFLNSSIYPKLKKMEFPPTVPVITMLFYYIGVLYVGITYEQNFQLYGGLVCSLLLFISLVLMQNHSNE